MADESAVQADVTAQSTAKREEGTEHVPLCWKISACHMDDGYFTKNFSFEGESSGCHGDTFEELSSTTEITCPDEALSNSFLSEHLFGGWGNGVRPGGPDLQLHCVRTPERRALDVQDSLEAGGQAVDLESRDEYKQDLKETIQLCEALMSEKAAIVLERDRLAQHLLCLQEANQALRQEKEYLLQEMKEEQEVEEFKALEEESTRQYESELAAEISRLQRASEASEAHVHNLESDLAAMCTELKRKEELILELQSLWNKDSAQEIRQLKRSLQDAEVLSRDTRKEWALLRSEAQALRESEAVMAAAHAEMEAEVKALRGRLEAEKRRFRDVEADLLKELQSTFQENLRLSSLLGGKADKTVMDLRKSLEESQERERDLQARVAELELLQERERDLQARVAELEQLQKSERDLQATVAELEQLQKSERDLQARVAELEQLKESERILQTTVPNLQQSQEEEKKLQARVAELEQFQERERVLQARVAELEQFQERERVLQARVAELEQFQERERVLQARVAELEQFQERERVLQDEGAESKHPSILPVEQDVLIKRIEELNVKLRTSEEELEKLRPCMTSFAQEREQLMEVLEGLREERGRLRRDLQESQEMVSLIEQQQSEQQHVYSEQQVLWEKQQADLQLQEMRIRELEAALAAAERRASSQEVAHHLQTELQDIYAQLAERDRALQCFEQKLEVDQVYGLDYLTCGRANHVSQVDRGVGLQKKRDKAFRTNLERTVLSPRNHEEIITALDCKEMSRKPKEAHRTQQQSSQSPLVDPVMFAMECDTTRGHTIKSPVTAEGMRQVNTHPEIHVTSLQETTKWRRRATQLKENLVEPDMLQLPRTPTRGRCTAASEGRIFDSPKSRFFDSRSDGVRLNCPRQFFDNSTLGALSDLSPASEDKNGRVSPLSPRQDENCKAQ